MWLYTPTPRNIRSGPYRACAHCLPRLLMLPNLASSASAAPAWVAYLAALLPFAAVAARSRHYCLCTRVAPLAISPVLTIMTA